MIDARSDLAGAVDEINAKLDRLFSRFTESEKPIPMSEAARVMGKPVGWLSKPWNVPDYKRNGTAFPESVWRAWIETTEADRRAAFDMRRKTA